MPKLGGMLYIIGFFGAIILGILQNMAIITEIPGVITYGVILVVIGILIGLMNIDSAEKVPVMLAILALPVITGVLAVLPTIGGILESILINITALGGGVLVSVASVILFKKLSN